METQSKTTFTFTVQKTVKLPYFAKWCNVYFMVNDIVDEKPRGISIYSDGSILLNTAVDEAFSNIAEEIDPEEFRQRAKQAIKAIESIKW